MDAVGWRPKLCWYSFDKVDNAEYQKEKTTKF